MEIDRNEKKIINSSSDKTYEHNFINEHNTEENIEKELKNARIETILSLRKKNLNDYILEKRKKYWNQIIDVDVYINIDLVKLTVPSLLIEEFDIYEEKLSVCHQFFNDDFTLLHGMDYNPDSVKLFILYKLIKLTYEGDKNDIIYEDKFEGNLREVFYDLIKIINESKNIKILFGVTTVLVNFLFSSRKLNIEFRKLNGIWKRFQEISELKNSEINDNIIKIMINIYVELPLVGKEYIELNKKKSN